MLPRPHAVTKAFIHPFILKTPVTWGWPCPTDKETEAWASQEMWQSAF